MPSNTPAGYPYPLPTEPVAEGAAAIRALAESLDSHRRIYLASQPTQQDTAATYSFWPSAGVFTVPIPAGYTHALLVWYVQHVYNVGTASELWVRTNVGATVGREVTPIGNTPASQIHSYTLADEIALAGLTGNQGIALSGRHAGAGSQYRVDASTRIALDLAFIKR